MSNIKPKITIDPQHSTVSPAEDWADYLSYLKSNKKTISEKTTYLDYVRDGQWKLSLHTWCIARRSHFELPYYPSDKHGLAKLTEIEKIKFLVESMPSASPSDFMRNGYIDHEISEDLLVEARESVFGNGEGRQADALVGIFEELTIDNKDVSVSYREMLKLAGFYFSKKTLVKATAVFNSEEPKHEPKPEPKQVFHSQIHEVLGEFTCADTEGALYAATRMVEIINSKFPFLKIDVNKDIGSDKVEIIAYTTVHAQ
jgi:hypothetical protein